MKRPQINLTPLASIFLILIVLVIVLNCAPRHRTVYKVFPVTREMRMWR